MTGAPNELDPSRQESPQAKPDILIAPTEGQRRAATIQRRKRIGKHLSEALIAAVVGGVVTIMVWHQASPPTAQTTETPSVVIAGSNPGATSASPITLPAQSGAQTAAIAPRTENKPAAHPETDAAKGNTPQTTAKLEIIPTPVGTPMNATASVKTDDGRQTSDTLAKSGAVPTDDMMEDAISAEMEAPLAESASGALAMEPGQTGATDSAKTAKIDAEEARQVPVIQAKSEPVKPTEGAIPMAKPEAKTTPLPAPKAAVHAADAKAAPMIDPKAAAATVKTDAKPATTTATATLAKPEPKTHSEAKAGFPQVQADGHFLVTAGSYSNALGAEKIQKKLTDAGIPVRLRKSTLNNHTVHHLLTGPFANAELAGQAVATIKERTGVEARYVSMPEANPQSAKTMTKQPATAVKESAAKENQAKAATPAKEIIKAMAPAQKETAKAAAPIKEIAKAAAPVATPAAKESKEVKEVAKIAAPAAKESAAKAVVKEVAKVAAPVKETKEVAKAAAPVKETKETKEVAKVAAPVKETKETKEVAKASAPATKESAKAAVKEVAKASAPATKESAKAAVKEVAKASAPATKESAKAAVKEVAKASAPATKESAKAAVPAKKETTTAKAKEHAAPHAGEFVANAGSFSNPDNANQLRRRLTERGIPSYSKVSTINGKEYTHVMVGPYSTQREADVKMGSVQKEVGVMAKAMPVH
ncbi:MAG: SPOR domain-containing protein [Magnetococcales bacterium]|nr:SPOR domain-containing protein [Magnetococcales bacterium]